MIFRWMLLLLALALPATTLAGSYRVIFGGAITGIDNGAPDSFSIGERVLGTYEFNTEPESTTWTEWIEPSYSTYGPIWYVGDYGDPPTATTDPPSIVPRVHEIIRTGPLLLMTESGFVATDTATEIYSSWTGQDPNGIPDDLNYPRSANIGNQGRFLKRQLVDPETVALHTFLGPTASGIELFLEDFAPSPALVADDIGQNGELNRPLHSFIDPESLRSLSGGVITFGKSSGSFAGQYPAFILFDIDTLRIVAIPEPTTLTLLLFAMLATFRPTPLRRASS